MCILCMWNTCVQTGCLACVPAPSIRVYEHTTQSSYGHPLCYINLMFVKRPFAKLYNVNLLGTFVGLAYLVKSNLKINRWRHDLCQWYHTCMVGIIETFETTHRRGIKSSHFRSSCSDGLRWKRATNTLQKSCLFSTFFTFLQKCKRTRRNFDIWTIQKYQNPEIEFHVIFHDVNTSGVDYAETLRWGTFLITIERVTFYIYIYTIRTSQAE